MKLYQKNIRTRADEVFIILIAETGENIGKMPLTTAFSHLENTGLDLVEVGVQDNLPVCRLMDYGKVKFNQQKNKKSQKPKRKKEITIRGNIGIKDLERKAIDVHKFVNAGHDVVVTIITARNRVDKRENIENIMSYLPITTTTSVESVNPGKRIIKIKGS